MVRSPAESRPWIPFHSDRAALTVGDHLRRNRLGDPRDRALGILDRGKVDHDREFFRSRTPAKQRIRTGVNDVEISASGGRDRISVRVAVTTAYDEGEHRNLLHQRG